MGGGGGGTPTSLKLRRVDFVRARAGIGTGAGGGREALGEAQRMVVGVGVVVAGALVGGSRGWGVRWDIFWGLVGGGECGLWVVGCGGGCWYGCLPRFLYV